MEATIAEPWEMENCVLKEHSPKVLRFLGNSGVPVHTDASLQTVTVQQAGPGVQFCPGQNAPEHK